MPEPMWLDPLPDPDAESASDGDGPPMAIDADG
jgi:hypothetical protein